MPYQMAYYNCGAYILGGWNRGVPTEHQLKEAEKEIKEAIAGLSQGWAKMIISTMLKDQKEFRKLLVKYGFKKTPEALSKYDVRNTQCIYYYDSTCAARMKEKAAKAQLKERKQ